MTEADRERIKAIWEAADRATPGPWKIAKNEGSISIKGLFEHVGYLTILRQVVSECSMQRAKCEATFDFIGAARAAVPWLCDLAERQAEEIGRLKSQLESAQAGKEAGK